MMYKRSSEEQLIDIEVLHEIMLAMVSVGSIVTSLI